MNIAAKQLKETDKNISDIALSLGYANRVNFQQLLLQFMESYPRNIEKENDFLGYFIKDSRRIRVEEKRINFYN